jgi:Secretion system C-terminal sorting domain
MTKKYLFKKLQLQSKSIFIITFLVINCQAIAQNQWVFYRDSMYNGWNTSICLTDSVLYVIGAANHYPQDTMNIELINKNTGKSIGRNNNYGIGISKFNVLAYNQFDSSYNFIYSYVDSLLDTLDDHYRSYFARADKNGNIIFAKRISDSFYSFVAKGIIISDSISYWVGGYNEVNNNAIGRVYFKLYLISNTGTKLWQDSFSAPPFEYMSNMINDNAGNLYMCGVDYINDFLDDEYKFLVKKVNVDGTLILNKYFPNPFNCSWPYLVKLPNNNMVLINIQNDSVTANHYNDLGPLIRMQFLDSNLIVYKTTLTRCDGLNSYYTMQLTNKGNIVFVGSKFTNKTYKLSPWFAILDTNGNVLCNKTYTIRGTTAMYFACVTQDAEGNFYIGGTIGADSVHTQDGLVIKLDSNGCLDNNYCYPLGFKEVVPEPVAQLNVYPNPASNAITIALNLENLYGGVLSIYNANGQLVQLAYNLKKLQNINVSTWPKGIYLVRYAVHNQTFSSRFVVE